MKHTELVKKARQLAGSFRVTHGKEFRLKDGAIKHVMSGVNPQGCDVHSFKAPTSDDLDHVGIFNHSYYEETLSVRVHPENLASQKIRPQLITKDVWDDRCKDIRTFESYRGRNGGIVVKFFLHVSKVEQMKRFLERIGNPDKNWSFSASDAKSREFRDDYMEAYEETIGNTAAKDSPCYAVPADNKWFTRLVVAAAVIEALDSLGLEYPKVGKDKLKDLAEK